MFTILQYCPPCEIITVFFVKNVCNSVATAIIAGDGDHDSNDDATNSYANDAHHQYRCQP